eukprot:6019645-Heterocapsa_arctica.AAC.1
MLKRETNWAELDGRQRIGQIGRFLVNNRGESDTAEDGGYQVESRGSKIVHSGTISCWVPFHGFTENEIRQELQNQC